MVEWAVLLEDLALPAESVASEVSAELVASVGLAALAGSVESAGLAASEAALAALAAVSAAGTTNPHRDLVGLFMMRGLALLLAVLAANLFAQEPAKDPDSFDIEPPLLIPNRGDESSPGGQPAPSPARDVDLAKLEKEFERAKRNIASLDRLLKIGALSKLEVEQRRLRVVHLEFQLADARLVAAKEKMLEKDKQMNSGEVAKTDVTPTENSLALAIQAAHAAHAKSDQADIAAAEANVHRQQKLLALGSARKSDVERAIQKLTELESRRSDIR